MRNYNGWEVVNEALKFLSEKKDDEKTKETGVVGGAAKGAALGALAGGGAAGAAHVTGHGLGGKWLASFRKTGRAGKGVGSKMKHIGTVLKKVPYGRTAALGAVALGTGIAAKRAIEKSKKK